MSKEKPVRGYIIDAFEDIPRDACTECDELIEPKELYIRLSDGNCICEDCARYLSPREVF
jgi:hypothetical protein